MEEITRPLRVLHYLIGVELDDELNQVQERWKNWSKQKMVTSGLALFDLTGRTLGRFFGDPILVFEVRGGGPLPFHRLATETWSSSLEQGLGERRLLKA